MATHSSILAGKPGGYSLWGLRELDKMTEQLNTFTLGFPGGSDSKASARNAKDPGSIPGLGRSPGEGKWQSTPGTLPWKIPWTESPDRLQSMGSQRVQYD